MPPYSPLLPLSNGEVEQLSPATWAYLGDAVYELFIRTRLLLPATRLQVYHRQVIAQVCAEAQAEVVSKVADYLTPSELDIVKRGRNAASGKPKRVKLSTYQQATGLEALLGYLYLTDPPRLEEVLAHVSHVIAELTDPSVQEIC
ncbi:MAG: ribonuclease III domain-containing protein [Thermosynechococcaceae cyanobacterium]